LVGHSPMNRTRSSTMIAGAEDSFSSS
jgi:hypothetical protein